MSGVTRRVWTSDITCRVWTAVRPPPRYEDMGEQGKRIAGVAQAHRGLAHGIGVCTAPYAQHQRPVALRLASDCIQ
eukprot:362881-Chlamydomonas_euryale.AAC.4